MVFSIGPKLSSIKPTLHIKFQDVCCLLITNAEHPVCCKTSQDRRAMNLRLFKLTTLMWKSMVEYYLNLSISLFLKIFKMWAISKVFTELVTILLLLYFGFLAPRHVGS